MKEKYTNRFLLFLFTVFLFGSFSCGKSMICLDCDPPPPKYYEKQIEGYIDENVFKSSSVAYCEFAGYPKPRSELKPVDNLKARLYEWSGEIAFETDIYLQEKEESDTEEGLKVIIYSSAFFPREGQVLKIVKLDDNKEETHILAEIKRGDLPGSPFLVDCKKIPFILN